MAEIVPKTGSSNVRSIKSRNTADPYVEHATRESDSETDVFTLVTAKGYRPDRFYTRSLNADGHGERMTIRVPLGLDGQINEQVNKIVEYRSHQDFFRDAALHRLEYLQQHTPDDSARRFCEGERTEADREKRRQEVIHETAKVASIKQSLQEQWDAQDYGLMEEELKAARLEMETTREPYRTQIGDCVTEWSQRAGSHIKRHNAEREDR